MDIAKARIEPVSLPKGLQSKILSFMRFLGLQYGALDFRLTPDGRYVFLEINPAGQWLFIEQETQQQISRAMAELMSDKDDQSWIRL